MSNTRKCTYFNNFNTLPNVAIMRSKNNQVTNIGTVYNKYPTEKIMTAVDYNNPKSFYIPPDTTVTFLFSQSVKTYIINSMSFTFNLNEKDDSCYFIAKHINTEKFKDAPTVKYDLENSKILHDNTPLSDTVVQYITAANNDIIQLSHNNNFNVDMNVNNLSISNYGLNTKYVIFRKPENTNIKNDKTIMINLLTILVDKNKHKYEACILGNYIILEKLVDAYFSNNDTKYDCYATIV